MDRARREGWSLAELFQVQCVIAASYVVPYSAPSSFERLFEKEHPLLYRYFQEASMDKICWRDVIHWMWPLFTDDWGSWRRDSLNLSYFPFTDPITNLPMWHLREKSPLLLYGFSEQIVEHPGYWPSNVHVCGFWFLPMEWQFSCSKCREMSSLYSSKYLTAAEELCATHVGLQHFMMKSSGPCLPIFIGLSSVGSMGFLRNPRALLLVLKSVVERTDYRFILFSSGYKPLDAAIRSIADASSNLDKMSQLNDMRDETLLFGNQLFCFSGVMPYMWLFPRCAVVVHHGGSGSTAAALQAGVPQVLCPFMLDQFYWAERMCWLGVAPEPLERNQLVPDNDDAICIEYAAKALTKALKTALSHEIKRQAFAVGERIALEDGVGEGLKVLKEEVLFMR